MRKHLSKAGLAAIFAAATLVAGLSSASAADKVTVAIGQRGFWDTAVTQLGKEAGIFAKFGIDPDILYTHGGGETLQAVISGSSDIGVAVGTTGVLGAYAKGAPLRIIGAEAVGAAEYWFVRADSKLKSIKDAGPSTTIAYSANGSSTNAAVLEFMKKYGLKAQPTATGSPPATFTETMTGQVDIGWSTPPFGLKEMKANKIRIVARANDLDSVRDHATRSLIANAQFLDQHHDVVVRFMQAYRATIDWMYSSPDALQAYAKFAKVDAATAKQVRDEFLTKPMLDPDKMVGMDDMMQQAVAFKTLSKPLGKDELDKLIQIPPRK